MKQLLFLIMLLINLTAIAQNPPPLKQRSDGSFTQGDTYLAVLKGLQIPSGATNTLTGTGTRVNLFYNTEEKVLYIYNGLEWKPAIEADLTKFYTKTEVDQLLASNNDNFIKNNPTSSPGQHADINISGSLRVGTTASTNISNASISMSTQSGGGSINYNGLSFGSAEGNFGLDYNSVRGGTNAGTFRLDKTGIVATESGKNINLTSSNLYLNDANINRSVNLSPSDLSFRNPGNKTLIVQGDDIPPNSMINISWPIKTGRLALESDFSQYAKLIGDNAFKMDFDNGSGLTLSYLNNTDGVPQKTYLQPGSILLLSDTIGGSKPPYLSLTPDGVSFAKGNAFARIYVSDSLTTSRSIILRDKDITVAGLEDLTDYAKLNQSNTFTTTQNIVGDLKTTSGASFGVSSTTAGVKIGRLTNNLVYLSCQDAAGNPKALSITATTTDYNGNVNFNDNMQLIGSLSMASLSGIGDRPIVADASGVLKIGKAVAGLEDLAGYVAVPDLVDYANTVNDNLSTKQNIVKNVFKGAFSTIPVNMNNDIYLVDASSTPIDVLLPDLYDGGPNQNKQIIIKKTDNGGNQVRIWPHDGDKIENETTLFLSSQWDYLTLVSAGSNYWIITAYYQFPNGG